MWRHVVEWEEEDDELETVLYATPAQVGLFHAAEAGDAEAVAMHISLVQAESTEDCESGALAPLDITLLRDERGNTLLNRAVWGGHEELARWLVAEFGFSIASRDAYGFTPLADATWYAQVNAVRFLLDAGSPVLTATHNGMTLIDICHRDFRTIADRDNDVAAVTAMIEAWTEARTRWWRPQRHRYFPKAFRDEVFTVLVIARSHDPDSGEYRYASACLLPLLPSELLCLIFAHLASQHVYEIEYAAADAALAARAVAQAAQAALREAQRALMREIAAAAVVAEDVDSELAAYDAWVTACDDPTVTMLVSPSQATADHDVFFAVSSARSSGPIRLKVLRDLVQADAQLRAEARRNSSGSSN
ncbi:uncharacterized protein AMSG_03175 [Thecamonas trahens ATCC 50062]|uniref:Uncharacterized protein n=1 Tax=Thecamonas trahens ATCC 50062 TaxID=461836 RepID=A0A0L0D3L5_THETB|nr:hypothetical protein AMSG_03175 [Thecamonas trahens ATCC 50062]KNC46746.1 hypothetical protein AMSG_03175 [Thecamonas trahens ATCC 50062]|eukprot:XP_013760026.1 hypothetical protein AMSG_03175 [Thecamonas trahens ATCC 50062]